MNLRQQKSQLRRERILRVATHVFSKKGYRATRVDDIAREAEVSKGLIYMFFSSKQYLFEAVLKHELLVWLEQTAQLASDPEDPLAEMQRMFTVVFDLLRNNPNLQTILGDESAELKRYWPVLKQINLRWRKRVIALLREGVAKGQFRPDLDISRIADIIHSLQRTYLDRAFKANDGRHAPDEELIAVVGEFISYGIRRPKK